MNSCILLLVLTLASASAICPSGWLEGIDPNKCYQLQNAATTWLHAEYNCQKLGGHLASFDSSFANRYVLTNLNAYAYVWLGLTTLYADKAWAWSDMSTFGYTNFQNGVPPPSNSQCLTAFTNSANWYAQNCSLSFPYVCEQRLNQNSPQTPPSCPEGWLYVSELGKCYRYFLMDYFDIATATGTCQAAGAQLASFHSFGEAILVAGWANVYLQPTYGKQPPCGGFIGLSNLNGTGWQWTDGTPFDYDFWAANNPVPGDDIAIMACYSATQSFGFYSGYSKNYENEGAYCEMPAKVGNMIEGGHKIANNRSLKKTMDNQGRRVRV